MLGLIKETATFVAWYLYIFETRCNKILSYLQAAEKHVTAEETAQQLQTQLQDLQAELSRVRDRCPNVEYVSF